MTWRQPRGLACATLFAAASVVALAANVAAHVKPRKSGPTAMRTLA
jgi:hypothetical protein